FDSLVEVAADCGLNLLAVPVRRAQPRNRVVNQPMELFPVHRPSTSRDSLMRPDHGARPGLPPVRRTRGASTPAGTPAAPAPTAPPRTRGRLGTAPSRPGTPPRPPRRC